MKCGSRSSDSPEGGNPASPPFPAPGARSEPAVRPGNGSLSAAAAWLAVSAALFAALSAFPMEGAFPTPSGTVVQGWFNAGVRRAFPAIAAALVLLSAAAWRTTGRRLRGADCGLGSAASVLQSLRPLAWLPAIAAFRHSSALFGTAFAGLFLPLGAPALLALCAERLARGSFGEGRPARPRAKPVLAVLLLGAAFLAGVWAWQGRGRFLGGGDVLHYETQLQNLLERGDLDLTDRVEGWMDRAGVPAAGRGSYLFRSHMRRNADGRIHSVHAFGWPLLAWPFAAAAGDAGETALGVLLGALALAGVFAASRRLGASAAASAVATAFLGASWFWAYTALSRLPEMLGCALCIWGFWAVLKAASGDGGRVAAAVSAACCAYLPCAHMRFFPIAAVLAAWAAAGLFRARRGAGLPRLRAALLPSAHLAAVLAGWAVLWRVHAAMFAGVASFSFREIFFSHPISMLGLFVERRGVGPVFPLAWLLCLAPVPFLSRARPREIRSAAALALALEGTTLVACCANQGALVGACVSARYFLQAIPPLVPFGALWLDRAGRPGRAWWFFLALLPVLYLLAVSPSCSAAGLVRSPYGLWEFDAFRTFWMPFRLTFSPLGTGQAALCLVLPAALVAVSFLLGRPGARPAVAVALLAAGALAGLRADSFLPRVGPPASEALGNAHHWHEFRAIGGPAPSGFFETFADGEFAPAIVAETPAGTAPGAGPRRIDASLFPDNDWGGRGLRWGLLRAVRTKPARRSSLAIRVAGRVEAGSARLAVNTPQLAYFPDGVSVGEGPFEHVFFVPRKKGDTLVVAALEGPGSVLRVDAVDVAPWAVGLEKGAGPLPEGARFHSALPNTPERP